MIAGISSHLMTGVSQLGKVLRLRTYCDIHALAKINFANLSPISTLLQRDCWHSHRSRVWVEGGKIPHLNEFSSDRFLDPILHLMYGHGGRTVGYVIVDCINMDEREVEEYRHVHVCICKFVCTYIVGLMGVFKFQYFGTKE